MNEKNKHKILAMTQISMMAAFLVLCSWISIPISTIPISLQTFGVFLVLLLLGAKKGMLSILLYIMLGMLGLPVFSGFSGGFARIVGPTGGYIVGFLGMGLCVMMAEYLFGRSHKLALYISEILGLLVCYAFGTIWFVFVYSENISFLHALEMCVIPYIGFDLLKFGLAVVIAKQLMKIPYFQEFPNSTY